jgi:hypothetical protein
LIHDTTDLNWGIDRVLNDLSGYYLIGYGEQRVLMDVSAIELGEDFAKAIDAKVHVRCRVFSLGGTG